VSTALLQQTCRDYVRLLGSFLDGELDPPGMLEVESHVSRCTGCREHVELLRATRASMQRTVRRNAPDALRNRIAVAMNAETARSEARETQLDAAAEQDRQDRDDKRTGSRFLGWRTMVPLASAAALALFWGAATRGPANANHLANSPEQTAGIGDDLLAELVAEHSQPLPPEATDAKSVRGLEKYVGVPLHPGSFEKGGARLVGGRVIPMRQMRAAMLQYVVMNGDEPRRVSVIVYDPSKIQVNSSDLSPRAVGTARVQVGRSKGYSVALMQRGGVGYALATDMDADRSAQFVAHAYEE
jgi:anti-sigma factor RsiW